MSPRWINKPPQIQTAENNTCLALIRIELETALAVNYFKEHGCLPDWAKAKS